MLAQTNLYLTHEVANFSWPCLGAFKTPLVDGCDWCVTNRAKCILRAKQNKNENVKILSPFKLLHFHTERQVDGNDMEEAET